MPVNRLNSGRLERQPLVPRDGSDGRARQVVTIVALLGANIQCRLLEELNVVLASLRMCVCVQLLSW